MYSVDTSYDTTSCKFQLQFQFIQSLFVTYVAMDMSLHSVLSAFMCCTLIRSQTHENSERPKTYATNLTRKPYPSSLTFFVYVNTF